MYYAGLSLIQNKDNLFLAITRKNNNKKFGLPGGKFELSDISLQRTALRELKEETGIVASFESGMPIFSQCNFCENDHMYMSTTFIWSHLHIDSPSSQSGEGDLFWVSSGILCSEKYSPYFLYNQKLFDNINVKITNNRIAKKVE